MKKYDKYDKRYVHVFIIEKELFHAALGNMSVFFSAYIGLGFMRKC